MAGKKKAEVDPRSLLTEENVLLLEQRFRDGATILEAIEGVMSESTYHKHRSENAEFDERMDHARDYITEIAQSNVAKRIKRGDTQLSTWWLERRKRDQFSTRSEVSNSGEQKLIVETRHYDGDSKD